MIWHQSSLSKSISVLSLIKHKCHFSISGVYLVTLLKQCSNLKHIQQTHGLMIFRGFDQDNFHLSHFIDSCSSLGFFHYAYLVFTHKSQPNVYLYNTIIKALSNSPSPFGAIFLFNKIQAAGLRPDTYSFPFVLKAVVKLSALEIGRQIHCQSIGPGLDFDVHVVTALVQTYGACKCISDARKLFDGLSLRAGHVALWNAMVAGYVKVGDLKNARGLFERMTERNVISWTILIAGYAQIDLNNEAISIFQRMVLEDVEPDEIALLAALSACAHLGAIGLGECIHNYIDELGLYKTIPLNNALIDMYAKSGNMEKALHVCKNMKNKSVITWTTMIAGLALHGLGREALDMFSQMEMSGTKPNEITFIAILSACSHVGFVELGRSFFENMKLRYGIEPKVEHYGCMIDLLSRAGYLQEARELLETMPFDANAAIWGSLLAASNIYGDAELGECALLHLIKLEPHNSGNYTLLSNIYASLGKWSESRMVRNIMRNIGVKKMPGWSYIEVNSRVHEFIAGDTSHPDFDRIYQVLCKLHWQLKTTQHLQNESCRLLVIDEG
ncbi:pentatricopeptide repeat-containing protein At5g56310 [Pistacia vera]|uniref:pentatricopeptide repeat-containing protein At5g56310 n=1 Tax=Pistacia vera TaxID=55513 RepID=UPI001263339F|nr:pentatricopeptide repeat-containing protein At5g56310 [Pistacia vera]